MDSQPPPVEAAYSLEHHTEGESRRLDAALHLVELHRETEDLRRVEPSSGHVAKTLVKLPALRVVLISLKAGEILAKHRTDGPITVQTLSGLARVQIDGEAVEVPVGKLLVLARTIPHDLEALEDSEVLLTIARRRPDDDPRAH